MTLHTFDKVLVDSTGAFLQGELEVIDQTLHLPDVATTWSEDILPRTDINLADSWASWTNSTYGRVGGLSSTGKSWGGNRRNGTPSVSLDIQKQQQELYAWELEVDWDIFELEAAAKLGRPIDFQKVTALGALWNQDVDNQAYLGDGDLGGTANSVTGLFNSDSKLVANNLLIAGTPAANGYTPIGSWLTATPAQILADVRAMEINFYNSTGTAKVGSKLLISPTIFSTLLEPLIIGGVAFQSILDYISKNSFCIARTGKALDIQPRKYLETSNNSIGAGRAVLYDPAYETLRFPLTPLAHTPIEYRGTLQLTTYYSKIGQLEIVMPNRILYLTNV